jgi:nucleoside-diphosphate-sugar epimerase
MATILVTGSEGLVGSALARRLRADGHHVLGLDLRAHGAEHGDTRRPGDLARALATADGVVHLAAVSRVVWGERDPDACWSTNVDGTANVLDACARHPRRPWVLFASSREVYGQADALPVTEDAPLRPVNVYGRSKVAGEELVIAARARGLRTAVVRLANVYGAVDDHPDRVVPAFARAAVEVGELRVDGPDHVFDFTHLDDVTEGLARLVARLDAGAGDLPPVHLLPGQPVTLGQLAALAIELAGTSARVRLAPPRTYDVSRFYGDPSRAAALLDGWRARVSAREGLGRLIDDLRETRAAS